MKKIIVAATILALAASPAMAQLKKPAVTGDPIADIKTDLGQTTHATTPSASEQKILSALAKPFQDLANFIGEDADGAIALSTVIPALQDGHGQQCWMATKQFADVIKAHPVPLTLKVTTDLEALRLLMMASNNLCANVHCTQVFGDLATGIQQLAPLNASIPIPSLHDLCAKIPQVAVVPPITVPATPAQK
jgi:hypothetical protein